MGYLGIFSNVLLDILYILKDSGSFRTHLKEVPIWGINQCGGSPYGESPIWGDPPYGESPIWGILHMGSPHMVNPHMGNPPSIDFVTSCTCMLQGASECSLSVGMAVGSPTKSKVGSTTAATHLAAAMAVPIFIGMSALWSHPSIAGK